MDLMRAKSLENYARAADASGMKRSLSGLHLAMLGLSTIVGTGIFILIAGAAQRAGPAMLISFLIAGAVCVAAALCYAELSSLAPVAGGSYSYAYLAFGELIGWLVGCALIAEYSVAASAISVGWSNYLVFFIESLHASVPWIPEIHVPRALAEGYFSGGVINLPAGLIAGAATGLLLLGTRVSINAAIALMLIKVSALIAFTIVAIPAIHPQNFLPFAPRGLSGVGNAAASVFFAYLGFGSLASAAEETHNPRRNVPIGIVGAVAAATLLYMVVVAACIGTVGAQPLVTGGRMLDPGTPSFAAQCASLEHAGAQPLACSKQAIAYVLSALRHPRAASLLAFVVFLALPAAVISTLYGQSRLMFAIARDGLLPRSFSHIHPRLRTPTRMILLTGGIAIIGASLLPVSRLTEIANSGTLFAFFMAAIAVLLLRRRLPDAARPFRLAGAWPIASFAAIGCFILFLRLPLVTLMAFSAWLVCATFLYLAYGSRRRMAAREAETLG